MSYVIAAPEYVGAAATDLANIGSTISSANSAALGPASSVLPAGADEVSASIAALFDTHAQAYQALSAAAEAFHDQFVQLMSSGAVQYALTEAANAMPLQTVGQGVLSGSNAPSQALTSAQPLIGSAASAGLAAGATPAAAAGLAGGSAPVAPAAHLATAVPPVSAAPAALAPASTPVVAAPSGSAALVPASAPLAAMQAATPAYSPATAAAMAPVAAEPATMPVAAVQAETPELSPATAMPAMPAGTPVAAAPTAAYSPATPPHSPATAASAVSPKEQPAATGQVEMPPYSA